MELRTIFGGFFSSGAPLMVPPPPSSAPRVPGAGAAVDAMPPMLWRGGDGRCRQGGGRSRVARASSWARSGVEARELAGGSVGAGGDGDRSAAMEGGVGMMAAGGPL